MCESAKRTRPRLNACEPFDVTFWVVCNLQTNVNDYLSMIIKIIDANNNYRPGQRAASLATMGWGRRGRSDGQERQLRWEFRLILILRLGLRWEFRLILISKIRTSMRMFRLILILNMRTSVRMFWLILILRLGLWWECFDWFWF